MRAFLAALLAMLIATFGALQPAGAPAARAASAVKVAIIVGATGDVTPRYRSYANEVYTAARRYTPNVVRVYSPAATAAKVKAAVAGASVVVYLGHGNGWPSPYTYDPKYTTKDGFGLNYDTNGDGKLSDTEYKYYGEPWIRELKPAPNAVVLLFHLCYASGNPEGGAKEPSVTKARQRVDNYAAAFLQSGARAVLAIGHSHSPYYIDALFTTRQTIVEYWRNAPDARGHFASYASARNPGMTYQLDPDSPGYYFRSIAGKMSLRTQDVTGAPYADTSVDPPALLPGGNATPAVDGAPLYATPQDAVAGAEPAATLPAATKVRVDAKTAFVTAVGASPIWAVHTDGGASGYMPASSLLPRDSAAPRTWEVDDGAGTFSPNGDGTSDTLPISVRLSEPASWSLAIVDGDGNERDRADGTSDTASITWAPAAGSVADGTYRWVLRATDAWDNGPLEDSGTFTVDTRPPELDLPDAAAVPQFTPNGDGTTDTIGVVVGSSEPGSVRATILDPTGEIVDQASGAVGSAAATLPWDGRDTDGAFVPDGDYTLAITAVDRAGNRSDPQPRTVRVYAALGFVRASRTLFFPQDGDALASTAAISFRLTSAATVGATVRNAAGTVVRTLLSDAALEPVTASVTWNGRTDAGAMVPRGTYRVVVTATDGTSAASQAVTLVADAFRIAVSDTTPGRGQRLTVTATSAENLGTVPHLIVTQPGRAAWSVKMTKVATRVYRVTIVLKSGATGTLRLKVSARDQNGVSQSSTLSLRLH